MEDTSNEESVSHPPLVPTPAVASSLPSLSKGCGRRVGVKANPNPPRLLSKQVSTSTVYICTYKSTAQANHYHQPPAYKESPRYPLSLEP